MMIMAAEVGQARGSKYYLLPTFEWSREVPHRRQQRLHQSRASEDWLHESSDDYEWVLTDPHGPMECVAEVEM